jgi:hypothetical protein
VSAYLLRKKTNPSIKVPRATRFFELGGGPLSMTYVKNLRVENVEYVKNLIDVLI